MTCVILFMSRYLYHKNDVIQPCRDHLRPACGLLLRSRNPACARIPHRRDRPGRCRGREAPPKNVLEGVAMRGENRTPSARCLGCAVDASQRSAGGLARPDPMSLPSEKGHEELVRLGSVGQFASLHAPTPSARVRTGGSSRPPHPRRHRGGASHGGRVPGLRSATDTGALAGPPEHPSIERGQVMMLRAFAWHLASRTLAVMMLESCTHPSMSIVGISLHSLPKLSSASTTCRS